MLIKVNEAICVDNAECFLIRHNFFVAYWMEYLKEFKSSSISWAGYDREKKVLHVQFADNNTEYKYTKVPVRKWKELKEAASKGKYINLHIKPFHDVEVS